MKKIIVSSITLFFLFPIMSANAGGKRKSSKSQCPSAVVEGTTVASHCSSQTITCPRVALKDSLLDQRCRASGVTTLCKRYDNTPPPACVYISVPLRADEILPGLNHVVTSPIINRGGSEGGHNLGTPPNLNRGINIGEGGHTPPNQNQCFISSGEKRCRICATTIEPLVPKRACNNNEDCVVVPGDTENCSDAAVHKIQTDNYLVALKKEKRREQQEREERARQGFPIGHGACGGQMGGVTTYAYCAANDGDGPNAKKTCRVGNRSTDNPGVGSGSLQ